MASPKGSGYFAALFGILFFLSFIASLLLDIYKISPRYIFSIWLLLSSIVLFGWGFNRIKTGDDRRQVGQDTINFVLGFVAVTLAILSIILK
jgi:hypothetical protein